MDNLKIEAEKEAQVVLNYFKAQDYITAEVKAKKLIKKFPNFQAVYNLLGLCLQSQKKFLEAIKYYKIAIQNNPNFFVAINNLGLTYHNMGDLKNAKSVLITFEPHPRHVLESGTKLPLLMHIEKKLEILNSLYLDVVLVIPFDEQFSKIKAADFLTDIVVKYFHPSYFIIGYDHHFGFEREGSPQFLE